MGLTKEELKIRINYEEYFTYNGKFLDTQSKELIKNRIEEDIKDMVYQAVESNLDEGQEDVGYHNAEIDIEIKQKMTRGILEETRKLLEVKKAYFQDMNKKKAYLEKLQTQLQELNDKIYKEELKLQRYNEVDYNINLYKSQKELVTNLKLERLELRQQIKQLEEDLQIKW